MGAGRSAAVFLGLLAIGGVRARSSDVGRGSDNARRIVDAMLNHEGDPAEHRLKYMYLSEERSERTGGHLWTERVIETPMGKVRLLLAEDGKPLSPERQAAEKARLADIAAHPAAFQKREQAMKNDEEHAEQMLALLHKAFLFDEPRPEGSDLKIGFRPDPAYQPKTMEEKVLHSMQGVVLVDERTKQLHRIEGKIPADVSLGLGILGTIHAGSSFSTERPIMVLPLPDSPTSATVLRTGTSKLTPFTASTVVVSSSRKRIERSRISSRFISASDPAHRASHR